MFNPIVDIDYMFLYTDDKKGISGLKKIERTDTNGLTRGCLREYRDGFTGERYEKVSLYSYTNDRCLFDHRWYLVSNGD